LSKSNDYEYVKYSKEIFQLFINKQVFSVLVSAAKMKLMMLTPEL